MRDVVTKDDNGSIITVETFGGEDGDTLVLTYDFVAGTVTNHSDVPDADRVKPLTDEMRASFIRRVEMDTAHNQIVAAIANMAKIRDAARADQAVAAAMRDAANAESAAMTTLTGQAAALAGKSVLAITDLRPTIQGVGQVSASLAKTQKAIADQCEYRRQNDIALATAYDAIIYLAKKVTGVMEI